ncbi:MAG: hypothetical protein H6684_12625 [Deltaproteobacteria bacterium]|nr:hypothetical protein [Deltaproteobacteria bacterium]MCB9480040.1 hypothetical protein [Deltaproteobacteria bacterium]MCB9489569.1 hypothetical protein [Deltaproteobacteria bacterium]
MKHLKIWTALLALLLAVAVATAACGGEKGEEETDEPKDDAGASSPAALDGDIAAFVDIARVDDQSYAPKDTDFSDEPNCDPDPMAGMTYDESGQAGPLRQKAEEYDALIEQWHLPDYGSHLHVIYTDETQSEVQSYEGHGDSCIWTGTYINSQALRYHVTGDPQARANIIRSAASLSRHLHVTGRPGFIARYVGKQSNPGHASKLAGCDADENCHKIDSGEFAGDFWVGNTSRDQYTGWFLGMSTAYDLIDDWPTRTQIQNDVTEVLDALIAQDWTIIDVDGIKTTKAPQVLPSMQEAWALVGYHVTGEERFKEVFDKWSAPENQNIIQLTNISFPNRYAQHYGLNLAHENFFNLLRLSQPYCQAHEFALDVFKDKIRKVVDLAHNPWYTAIYLAQGQPETQKEIDKNVDQMIEDLYDFPDPPKSEYAMNPPERFLDPISVWLHDFQQDNPWLADIMGSVNYQALRPYEVKYQCHSGFMFQRNMWATECGGSDRPEKVSSGHDYLAAYWMATAYGYLTKDQ